MKVVDMFGCGLPVIAFGYETIQELVQHGKTGWLFTDASQLTRALTTLLRGFPRDQTRIQTLRRNVLRQHQRRWPENWQTCVAPLLH